MRIFLFMQIICNANALYDIYPKIIGGQSASIVEFPYAVRFFNKNSFCSGSILNSWSVLTAAHCVDVDVNVNDMLVGVGSSYFQDYNSSIYEVKSFAIHEDYNKLMQFAADIALLFVDGPITFSDTVQKAILCTSLEWAESGQTDNIIVTGWGWTKPNDSHTEGVLMQTTLKYIPKEVCEKKHNMKFTEDMFCLYGDGKKDACLGDSGGGVEWNGQIIGIVSHGHGCAAKDKPSVYISVYHHRDWIEKQYRVFVDNYCQTKQIDQKYGPLKIDHFHGKRRGF